MSAAALSSIAASAPVRLIFICESSPEIFWFVTVHIALPDMPASRFCSKSFTALGSASFFHRNRDICDIVALNPTAAGIEDVVKLRGKGGTQNRRECRDVCIRLQALFHSFNGGIHLRQRSPFGKLQLNVNLPGAARRQKVHRQEKRSRTRNDEHQTECGEDPSFFSLKSPI